MSSIKYISEKQATILARYYYLEVEKREAEVQEIKAIISGIFQQSKSEQEHQRKLAVELLRMGKMKEQKEAMERRNNRGKMRNKEKGKLGSPKEPSYNISKMLATGKLEVKPKRPKKAHMKVNNKLTPKCELKNIKNGKNSRDIKKLSDYEARAKRLSWYSHNLYGKGLSDGGNVKANDSGY
ncbi:10321_t:CDS:2 [Funneliformis geosporum]|nr:10321_t:CDS:2 [Funneliformis geosporum]